MTSTVKLSLSLAVLIFFFWTGAFLSYLQNIEVPGEAPTNKVGGIVILTGTPARLSVGFDLLKEGAGSRLLVSGVNSKVTRETLRQATGQSEAVMSCCVDLGRVAQNTEGNAEETARWADSHGFKRLLIVTSAYHMPRSLVELKRQLPNTTLIAYPVQNDSIDLQHWWQSPRATAIIAGEFNKYLFSLIRARLQSPLTDKETA